MSDSTQASDSREVTVKVDLPIAYPGGTRASSSWHCAFCSGEHAGTVRRRGRPGECGRHHRAFRGHPVFRHGGGRRMAALGVASAADSSWGHKNPKVGFLFYIFGGCALTLMGLATLGLIPAATMPVIAWLIFIVGALGFYVCIASMNAIGGVTMPPGKPFFK